MTTAIIQARYGSSRFPGKMLAPLAGDTLLGHVIRRVQAAESVDRVIVATCEPGAALIRHEVIKHRGTIDVWVDEWLAEDVLGRFVRACRGMNETDWIVRVCGDNPLIRPDCIDALVTAAEQSPWTSYAGYCFPGGEPAILRPNGYFAEAVRVVALREANDILPHDHPDREHVTKVLYRHSDHFPSVWLPVPVWYRGCALPMASVDTPYDLAKVQKYMEKTNAGAT